MWQLTVASKYTSALLCHAFGTQGKSQTIWSCSFILFYLNPFRERERKLTMQNPWDDATLKVEQGMEWTERQPGLTIQLLPLVLSLVQKARHHFTICKWCCKTVEHIACGCVHRGGFANVSYLERDCENDTKWGGGCWLDNSKDLEALGISTLPQGRASTSKWSNSRALNF